ncbi:malate dehydrogenase (oxaloacetate-decarboxylating) [Methylacidimicrobium cyclopophantes]|uniref:Malate dehydrogenase (Oxaloacetate-decarboxylating) n=1 Tax=Methylacidimicrobium cyclopophantes TaxID=1041766 RepID=A0A5E6MBE0_9BACT|nr:NAD-dependent malic enzyme [Methylacidimicrobium cyclopophantes]VVM06735.1 malate dehydrogenase (oxaloacetate-decarboxylating) [Methylacidimicrobium cyclopophantes]
MESKPISPSASYSFLLRLSYPNKIGMLANVVRVLSENGADLGAMDIVSVQSGRMIREITVNARSEEHAEQLKEAVSKVPSVTILAASDRVFLLHQGGKILVENKVPLTNRDTLSMAYTPGVARVCEAIAARPDLVYELTIKGRSVAVVSDGSAVLGLGDIGPAAAMPVMEGKAMLFREFGQIHAYPICLAARKVEEIVDTVARIAVGFGGINLEDISAPRCFEIEERLQERLEIPVFHDDQHGTAIVVLAALINSARLLGRELTAQRYVILGAGAAGVAVAKMLLKVGCRSILVCDRGGIVSSGRPDLSPVKQWLAAQTNPDGIRGTVREALKGADVFIGVSSGGRISADDLREMREPRTVFALANPTPEVMPEEAARYAQIVATGRSDYPNQINNVLAFPGVFQGALSVRASRITEGMKLAAAEAIASCIPSSEIAPEYIVPSVFNREVAQCVAEAVAQAAKKDRVVRT